MNLSANAAGLIENLFHEFQCGICLCLLKNPITLPCHHFYCKDCLDGLCKASESKGTGKCPECRAIFTRRTKSNDYLLEDVFAYLCFGFNLVVFARG